MRKIFVIVTLFLGILSGQAQEKVIKVLKKDGTTTPTRVADLKQIQFLTIEEGGQGLLVKTLNGGTSAVRFETKPVVTISDGKLIIKPSSSDAIEFEISDIVEILFGDASDQANINEVKGFTFILQDRGALLQGIPQGAKASVYSLDGRSFPVPSIQNGELRLNRATLGSGIFIVKIGNFSTKIKL